MGLVLKPPLCILISHKAISWLLELFLSHLFVFYSRLAVWLEFWITHQVRLWSLSLEKSLSSINISVRDRIAIYSQISIYSKRINHYPLIAIVGYFNSLIPIDCNCKSRLFWQLNSRVVIHEKFPRSVQVGFSLLVDLNWTLLGNVSCMTTQNEVVEMWQ